MSESATHKYKYITWLACTWLGKCTRSAAIINITCFNCILGRKKEEINFRKKESKQIKDKEKDRCSA
jgi:hypothetical protein